MNFRQVHLDFHTSEKIENIGQNFSKSQFQEALKIGHVNSITVFSKCHHGCFYHPTKTGKMHPHLEFDLLKAQIDAAHEIGVKTPVYISAGYDEQYANEHKNECRIDDFGVEPDFSVPMFHRICFNTPYLDVLAEQVAEVVQNYDCDGIFLDIVGICRCYCPHCIAEMEKEGMEINKENAYIIAKRTYEKYAKRMEQVIHAIKPSLPIFHNAGHVPCGYDAVTYSNTHLELESLPTGGWGYDHFPMSAAYARTKGLEFLGMTGKFHQSWGEFGGFKAPNALKYETALSVANGAKCSIGDQLHPDGHFDMATYKTIGDAYREIEKKEKYLDKVEAVADIALLSEEANYYHLSESNVIYGRKSCKATIGASRILLEKHYLFDVVDNEADLSKYKLLILPDTIKISEKYAEKLENFVKNGGKILATGESGLDENGTFICDLGAKFIGKSEYNPTYFRPDFDISPLYKSAYVIYSEAFDIESTGKTAAIRENPYFNRTAEHFCSHAHAPNDKKTSTPSITFGKNGAYIGYKIFEEYKNIGSLIAKQAVCFVIDKLLGKKISLRTLLLAQGVTTLMHQREKKRYINHLLYASPVKRGQSVEIIEDIAPIFDVEVSLLVPEKVKKIYLADTKKALSFYEKGGRIYYTVPKIECHQMVVLEY